MCLLIFIRISAATLHGQQTKLCNFTEILKAQKLKISRRPWNNEIFYYFAHWFSARKSRKIKSIVPDLSEKIMACMLFSKVDEVHHRSECTFCEI